MRLSLLENIQYDNGKWLELEKNLFQHIINLLQQLATDAAFLGYVNSAKKLQEQVNKLQSHKDNDLNYPMKQGANGQPILDLNIYECLDLIFNTSRATKKLPEQKQKSASSPFNIIEGFFNDIDLKGVAKPIQTHAKALIKQAKVVHDLQRKMIKRDALKNAKDKTADMLITKYTLDGAVNLQDWNDKEGKEKIKKILVIMSWYNGNLPKTLKVDTILTKFHDSDRTQFETIWTNRATYINLWLNEIKEYKSYDDINHADILAGKTPTFLDPSETDNSVLDTRRKALLANRNVHLLSGILEKEANAVLENGTHSAQDKIKAEELKDLNTQLSEVTKRWIDPHYKNPSKRSTAEKIWQGFERTCLELAAVFGLAALGLGIASHFSPFAPLGLPLMALGLATLVGTLPVFKLYGEALIKKIMYKRNPQNEERFIMIAAPLIMLPVMAGANALHFVPFAAAKAASYGIGTYGANAMAGALNSTGVTVNVVKHRKEIPAAPRIVDKDELGKHRVVDTTSAMAALAKEDPSKAIEMQGEIFSRKAHQKSHVYVYLDGQGQQSTRGSVHADIVNLNIKFRNWPRNNAIWTDLETVMAKYKNYIQLASNVSLQQRKIALNELDVSLTTALNAVVNPEKNKNEIKLLNHAKYLTQQEISILGKITSYDPDHTHDNVSWEKFRVNLEQQSSFFYTRRTQSRNYLDTNLQQINTLHQQNKNLIHKTENIDDAIQRCTQMIAAINTVNVKDKHLYKFESKRLTELKSLYSEQKSSLERLKQGIKNPWDKTRIKHNTFFFQRRRSSRADLQLKLDAVLSLHEEYKNLPDKTADTNSSKQKCQAVIAAIDAIAPLTTQLYGFEINRLDSLKKLYENERDVYDAIKDKSKHPRIKPKHQFNNAANNAFENAETRIILTR